MGKLSDVIQHASELSEETDDEDIWEEDETEAEAEEEADRRAGDMTEDATSTDDLSVEEKTASADLPTEEEAAASDEPDGSAGEDASEPVWDDAAGPENEAVSLAADLSGERDGASGSGAEDVSGSGPEESGEPECNEDGIPIKDVIYAESIRNRGKDLIVVQSVYDRKMLFDMLVRHAYLSTGGYCGLLISICAIGAAIYTYGKIQIWLSLVLLLAGSMFLIFEPFLLRDRAKQMTARGGIYHIPILFVLTPYGIELTRNGNHASHSWGDITRVTTTKYAVVLYEGKHTAMILSKQGIGDQKEDLYAMIRQCARSVKYMKLK